MVRKCACVDIVESATCLTVRHMHYGHNSNPLGCMSVCLCVYFSGIFCVFVFDAHTAIASIESDESNVMFIFWLLFILVTEWNVRKREQICETRGC